VSDAPRAATPGPGSTLRAGVPAPGDGFAPADLRACIHCGLCLQACPTYRTLRLEPGSPRGRIHLMRAFADARLAPEHPLLEYLDQCLGCRACQTACPAGVPYGRLLTQARGQLEPLRPGRSLSRRLGHWALERLVPDRAAMHRAADLGQRTTLIDWAYRWNLAQARLRESAREWDAALDDLVRRLDALHPAARRARGEARDRILAELAALDAELIERARASAPPRLVADVEREAAAELEPFAARLAPEALAAARRRSADRALRECLRLPVLTME